MGTKCRTILYRPAVSFLTRVTKLWKLQWRWLELFQELHSDSFLPDKAVWFPKRFHNDGFLQQPPVHQKLLSLQHIIDLPLEVVALTICNPFPFPPWHMWGKWGYYSRMVSKLSGMGRGFWTITIHVCSPSQSPTFLADVGWLRLKKCNTGGGLDYVTWVVIFPELAIMSCKWPVTSSMVILGISWHCGKKILAVSKQLQNS